MIVHIVIWNLHETAEGSNKLENAQKIKTMVEALNGKIPGLLKLHVGIDLIGNDNCGDVCLYSELESKAALEGYAGHPEHVKCIPFIKSVASKRQAMDYEV